MAQFYADENLPYGWLSRPSVSWAMMWALMAQEAGRAGLGIDDDTVLADATSTGRILLTQNRRDFIRRHNAGCFPHEGIIVCTYDPDAEARARRIDEAIASVAGPGRWLLRVNRPAK